MKHSILFATCSLLALTACGGSSIKDTLGLSRKAPDEFRVVARPPLSVPPQFNLRPPSSDAESPTVVPADKQAQSIVTGNAIETAENSVDTAVTAVESASLEDATPEKKKKGKSAEKKSSSESQFMKNIGADKADPKVRDELIKQRIAAQEKRDEGSWWNKITTTEKKETLVDAKEESKRIQTNKTENKPVTEGETPEVKDKDHGIIGTIFGW